MIQNRTLPSNGPTRRALMGCAAIGLAVLLVPGALRAADPLKVVGIYTVPVEQQWVSRIHKAAEGAQKSGQIAYEFTENVTVTDYPGVLREYAESGANLILGEVFGIEQEAREVAADYPDVAFLFGSSLSADDALPNVSVFDNYIQDASYLSGIIAAAMSENDNIGMVGGFPSPGVNRLMHAFMSGAREVTPDMKFQIGFIGSWFDPPKAKETAFAMIENGADVVYAERFGVADAAQEKGILAIGNVIDTQADYPDTVVASALWHFEPTLQAAIKAVQDGSFTAADYGTYSHIREGGASLAPLGTFAGRVPKAALDLLKQRAGEIESGAFMVQINDEEPRAN